MRLSVIEKILWIVAGLSGVLVATTMHRCKPSAPHEHRDTQGRP